MARESEKGVRNQMKKKIYIDAGHGGDSIGASYKGRLEQDDVLKLALAIGKLLKTQPNVEVKYSRTTNVNPDLTGRCKEANAWGADYFISIHRDACAPNVAQGATAYVYSKVETNGVTYNKAKTIVDGLSAAAGFKNRGVKKGAVSYTDFAVNRVTNMSSVLLEVGFIDSDTDNKIFDEKFEDMVLAISKGLCAAVGEKFIIPGDVNSDGKVDVEDARLILRYAVGLETMSENIKAIADMNGDGQVTVADAREALRQAVGLE